MLTNFNTVEIKNNIANRFLLIPAMQKQLDMTAGWQTLVSSVALRHSLAGRGNKAPDINHFNSP